MSDEIRQLNIKILNDRLKSLLKQKHNLTRTLNLWEEKLSAYGIDARPQIIIEIEDINSKITELDEKIKNTKKELKDERKYEIEKEEIEKEEPLSIIKVQEFDTYDISVEPKVHPSIFLQPTLAVKDQNIKIGVTASNTANLETIIPLVKIVEADINNYVKNLGHNIAFEFVIKDNQGSAAVALENTISFKAMDIDLIIGHPWSSQCQAALSYVNENDMILLSASSSSLILAIADDMLFRTCPNDYVQSPAIAQMWKTWGAEAVLTMHRGDAWGDGLWNILDTEWDKVGIVNLGRIRYAGEVTEFSSYLATANDIISDAIDTYGMDKVGMQFFSFSELRTIQSQATDYPNLINIIWMTTDCEGRDETMLYEVGELAVKTRHFSPCHGVNEGNFEFDEFAKKYYDLTGYDPGFYTAAHYDAFWLLIKCILETGSTDAEDIANNIIPISRKHWGLSGWLSLDGNGDRMPQLLDIWGFYMDPDSGEYNFRKWGQYDGCLSQVIWDDEALVKYAGVTRPTLTRLLG